MKCTCCWKLARLNEQNSEGKSVRRELSLATCLGWICEAKEVGQILPNSFLLLDTCTLQKAAVNEADICSVCGLS